MATVSAAEASAKAEQSRRAGVGEGARRVVGCVTQLLRERHQVVHRVLLRLQNVPTPE